MKNLLIISAVAFTTLGVQAQSSFQASLIPDIAIHSRDTEINGLTLSIWGENPTHGLSLGIINGSTGNSRGLTWGIVNYADSYRGIALGAINISRTSFTGWQDGFVNFSQGEFEGLQMGGLNVAQKMHGLQLGFVNYAEHLRGVQLGFINIAANNPWFTEFPDKLATGFPILNWSF